MQYLYWQHSGMLEISKNHFVLFHLKQLILRIWLFAQKKNLVEKGIKAVSSLHLTVFTSIEKCEVENHNCAARGSNQSTAHTLQMPTQNVGEI